MLIAAFLGRPKTFFINNPFGNIFCNTLVMFLLGQKESKRPPPVN